MKRIKGLKKLKVTKEDKASMIGRNLVGCEQKYTYKGCEIWFPSEYPAESRKRTDVYAVAIVSDKLKAELGSVYEAADLVEIVAEGSPEFVLESCMDEIDTEWLPAIERAKVEVDDAENLAEFLDSPVSDRLTTKQLARREQMGLGTLLGFIKHGWVSGPAIPDQFTEEEATEAHTSIRCAIAYGNGWTAHSLGYKQDERVPHVWGTDIDTAWHHGYQKQIRKAKA